MTVQSIFENILPAILECLDKAKTSIRICVPWFTDQVLCDKLIERGKDNIDVEIFILDHSSNKEKYQTNNGISEFNFFKLDLNKLEEHARVQLVDQKLDFFLHSKFCVIDRQIVITGSYNWSFYARSNVENIVIIEDETVARQYSAEFNRIKAMKYDRLMARDLPACVFCQHPAVRARIYDYFSESYQHTEAYKEFHFCLAEPVDHISMIKDADHAALELGDLLEDAYSRLRDESDANPNLELSRKSVNDRIAVPITQYFGTSQNLYTEPIGDRLALIAKRTGDKEDFGETSTLELIWAHPLADPFAENLRDFAGDIIDELYGL